MIDTVIAGFRVCGQAPPPEDALGWEEATYKSLRNPRSSRGRKLCQPGQPDQQRTARWRLHAGPHLEIVLTRWGQDQAMAVEVQSSLPNLLLGHNITVLTPDQHRLALRILDEQVAGALWWARVPPVGEWTVKRADWCHSWNVDCPSAYVAALEGVVTGRKTDLTTVIRGARHGGATFQRAPGGARNSWSEKAYDKGAQVRSLLANPSRRREILDKSGMTADELTALAEGVLRFEVMLRGRPLKAAIGEPPTVSRLTTHLEEHGPAVLETRWAKWTADWDPAPYDVVVVRLLARYPVTKARNLADLWAHLAIVGAETYRARFGVKSQTWRRWMADLQAAGVGLPLPEGAAGLPRLTLASRAHLDGAPAATPGR